MVWGALNTPLERASIQRLCNVMTDGVWASRAASDYLIPREDLGSVFAEPFCDTRSNTARNGSLKRVCAKLVFQAAIV